jgi:hypothetical protein
MQRVSTLYSNRRFDWVFWCLRENKGNWSTAGKFAEANMRKFKNESGEVINLADDFASFATLCALTDRGAQEVPALESLYALYDDETWALYTACGNDNAGKKARRDELLNKLDGASEFGKVAKLFKETLKRGEGESIDMGAIDNLVYKSSDATKGSIYYCVGRFLEARGRKNEALDSFGRCVRFNGCPETMTLYATIRLRNP